MSERSKTGSPKAGPACAICGKPATGKYAPFCSGRCADLDLGRWLNGGYAIPAGPDEAEAPDQSPGQVPDIEEK
jgi:endogenous inhibitor of DNA gyrase (YacG/DUF329 family)